MNNIGKKLSEKRNNSSIMYDYLFEICIFADEGVGKKTLKKICSTSHFVNGLMITIGVDFFTKTLDIFGLMVKQLFKILNPDEQFWIRNNREGLQGMYIRYCRGAIILFDITNLKTLNSVSEWCQFIRDNTKGIPILLIGNKLDLEDNREVSKEQLKKIKKYNGIYSSMEISLKNGKNVDRMFSKITRMMLKEVKYDDKIRSPSLKTIY